MKVVEREVARRLSHVDLGWAGEVSQHFRHQDGLVTGPVGQRLDLAAVGRHGGGLGSQLTVGGLEGPEVVPRRLVGVAPVPEPDRVLQEPRARPGRCGRGGSARSFVVRMPVAAPRADHEGVAAVADQRHQRRNELLLPLGEATVGKAEVVESGSWRPER